MMNNPPPLSALDREILKLATNPNMCRESLALVLAAGAVQAGKASLDQVLQMLAVEGIPAINLPSEEGRMMGAELARLTGYCPGACNSCGYTLGTVPNQSPTTVAHALECTMTGDVFTCHTDGKPCRGWTQSRQQANFKPEQRTPVRVTLSRRKGWKMPPNTVKVCRPSKWGNPWRVGDWSSTLGRVLDQAGAVERFTTEHEAGGRRAWLNPMARKELKGKNLACWCKPGEPCHADVLLWLANTQVELPSERKDNE